MVRYARLLDSANSRKDSESETTDGLVLRAGRRGVRIFPSLRRHTRSIILSWRGGPQRNQSHLTCHDVKRPDRTVIFTGGETSADPEKLLNVGRGLFTPGSLPSNSVSRETPRVCPELFQSRRATAQVFSSPARTTTSRFLSRHIGFYLLDPYITAYSVYFKSTSEGLVLYVLSIRDGQHAEMHDLAPAPNRSNPLTIPTRRTNKVHGDRNPGQFLYLCSHEMARLLWPGGTDGRPLTIDVPKKGG